MFVENPALRHQWYVVAEGADVTDAPVRVRLLGADYVVWRSPSGDVTDLRSATWLRRRAVSGRHSEIDTPGTAVWIDVSGPRTSRGASGLGSKVSRWLGPPSS